MRTVNRFKQHVTWVIASGALLIMVSMLLTQLAVAAPSQAGVSWDYRLLGKLNSALDPATGMTIVIAGSGSFNVPQPSIGGGGSYTILDAGGNAVGTGTWTATTLDGFNPVAPGNSPGEGGHLELEASFKGTGTGALNGSQHVVIQCSMWGPKVGPPGYPWPPDFVEVGPYTIHETGGVMFNLNQ